MRILKLMPRLLLVIFVTGCALQIRLQPSSQYVKTDKVASPLPMKTVIKSTLPPPTSTMTVTPVYTETIALTKTPLPNTMTPILQKCLQYRSSLPSNNKYDGTIVFIGGAIPPVGMTSSLRTSLYNLNTRQNVPFQYDKSRNVVISPDHMKYALLDENNLVKVISSNGKLIYTIPKGPYVLMIDRWLDNQQIELTVAKGYPTSSSLWNFPLNLVIANWMTHEQKLMLSEYPDIDRISGTLGTWVAGSTTEYDSELTRVVYRSASIVDDYHGQDGYGYILWDLVNKRKVVQIVSNYIDFPPVWSPDYSKFIIVGNDGEMYFVTREGDVMQITHNNLNLPQENYSWSPDGRYVAFWSRTKSPSFSNSFVIFDGMTDKITDYCISAGSGKDTSSFTNPVWSPDGKELVINANLQENGNFDTLFVDLEDGSATKIGENLLPMGWLINSTN
jgi:WD40-like Beta Propeller Repeat